MNLNSNNMTVRTSITKFQYIISQYVFVLTSNIKKQHCSLLKVLCLETEMESGKESRKEFEWK